MKNAVWRAFLKTGEPLLYLLYRMTDGAPRRAAENTQRSA